MSRTIEDHLDLAHIDAAAKWAARMLVETGSARVELTPGDMTRYRVMVGGFGLVWTRDGTQNQQEYWVSLLGAAFGGYPWNLDFHVDAGYAAEKWSSDSNPWTGAVVAAFLNALRAHLGYE